MITAEINVQNKNPFALLFYPFSTFLKNKKTSNVKQKCIFVLVHQFPGTSKLCGNPIATFNVQTGKLNKQRVFLPSKEKVEDSRCQAHPHFIVLC